MVSWHHLSSSDLTTSATAKYRKPVNIKSSCTQYIFPAELCRRSSSGESLWTFVWPPSPDMSLICFGRSPSLASSLTRLPSQWDFIKSWNGNDLPCPHFPYPSLRRGAIQCTAMTIKKLHVYFAGNLGCLHCWTEPSTRLAQAALLGAVTLMNCSWGKPIAGCQQLNALYPEEIEKEGKANSSEETLL